MDILFLGTGAAINTSSARSCYLINRRLLVDVGPEASSLIRRAGHAPAKIEAILATHLHGDHILGLPLLLSECMAEPPQVDRLRLLGPLGLEAATLALLQLSYPELRPERFVTQSRASFEVLKPFAQLETAGISVEVVPVVHGTLQAYGFFLEDATGSLFLTGDSVLCDTVKEFVGRADASLVDVTTTSSRLPTHMNVEDLLVLAEIAGPSRTLFAVHRTFDSVEAPASVVFPSDGDTYEVKRGCRPQRLPKQ